MRENIGVHATHCCKLHGCKYGDDDCPVETGKVEQVYLCEQCGEDGIKTLEEMHKVELGELKVCPYCNHVL